MSKQVSLHMLVRQEEQSLRRLLPAIKPWVGEMCFAVDDRSTDGTEAVCRQFSDKVAVVSLDMSFAGARNKALELATLPWILHLDADECAVEPFWRFMDKWILGVWARVSAGALIWRHNLVGGQEIGPATWERHVRLFRSEFRYEGRIHERLAHLPTMKLAPAPRWAYIQHYKTVERQEAQNAFYQAWEEQRRITGTQV